MLRNHIYDETVDALGAHVSSPEGVHHPTGDAVTVPPPLSSIARTGRHETGALSGTAEAHEHTEHSRTSDTASLHSSPTRAAHRGMLPSHATRSPATCDSPSPRAGVHPHSSSSPLSSFRVQPTELSRQAGAIGAPSASLLSHSSSTADTNVNTNANVNATTRTHRLVDEVAHRAAMTSDVSVPPSHTAQDRQSARNESDLERSGQQSSQQEWHPYDSPPPPRRTGGGESAHWTEHRVYTERQYDKGRYVGSINLRTDAREGSGRMYYRGGSVYNGWWHADQAEGAGEKEYANGDVYRGAWRGNRRSGYGVYLYAAGHLYEGNFVDDAAHGQGTLTLANGDRYVGQWRAGRKDGAGREVCRNGEVFEGRWRGGLRQGRGVWTMRDPSGSVRQRIRGVWNRGEFFRELTLAEINRSSIGGSSGGTHARGNSNDGEGTAVEEENGGIGDGDAYTEARDDVTHHRLRSTDTDRVGMREGSGLVCPAGSRRGEASFRYGHDDEVGNEFDEVVEMSPRGDKETHTGRRSLLHYPSVPPQLPAPPPHGSGSAMAAAGPGGEAAPTAPVAESAGNASWLHRLSAGVSSKLTFGLQVLENQLMTLGETLERVTTDGTEDVASNNRLIAPAMVDDSMDE